MPKPALRTLAILFFRIGNSTFGSGIATVVLLSREMNNRGWLQPWETDLAYTLARIVPGTNVLAFVAATGYALRGWTGSVTGVVALSVPASAVVVLLTLAYEQWHATRIGGAFIDGALSAIAGIIVAAACLLAIPRFRPGERVRTAVLVGLAALLSPWLAPLTIIGLVALIGFVWPDRP